MADQISHEALMDSWKEMVLESDDEENLQLIEQIEEEQPTAAGYLLLLLKEGPLEMQTREVIYYLGLFSWKVLREKGQPMNEATFEQFKAAREVNRQMLDLLASDTDADFASAVLAIIEKYPEPEVLRHIRDRLMDKDDDDTPLLGREERAKAFIHLKTLLDGLLDSRKPSGTA